MRRILAALFALGVCLSCSVCAFAFNIPYTWMEGGNTMFGTFKIAALDAEVKDSWKKWKTSSRNICFLDTSGKPCFTVIEDGISLRSIVRDGSFVKLTFSAGLNGNPFDTYSAVSGADGTEYQFEGGAWDSSPDFRASGIICGTFFTSTEYQFPNLGVDYLPTYEGSLYILDDLGEEGEPEGGGILDWLLSFWEKLKEFFLGLFVPPEGYFSDWFNEIKTAFEGKLGGMMDVINHIKEKLSGAVGSGAGLSLTLPDNLLFDGFRGISVNLLEHIQPLLAKIRLWLTGILVIWTAIRCYKRLISLTHT